MKSFFIKIDLDFLQTIKEDNNEQMAFWYHITALWNSAIQCEFYQKHVIVEFGPYERL